MPTSNNRPKRWRLSGVSWPEPSRADRAFSAGLCQQNLTYRLPAGHTLAGRQMRQQLQTLGVLRSTGHEHLNGCLVVPVGLEDGAKPQQAGRVMQLYGRRM